MGKASTAAAPIFLSTHPITPRSRMVFPASRRAATIFLPPRPQCRPADSRTQAILRSESGSPRIAPGVDDPYVPKHGEGASAIADFSTTGANTEAARHRPNRRATPACQNFTRITDRAHASTRRGPSPCAHPGSIWARAGLSRQAPQPSGARNFFSLRDPSNPKAARPGLAPA
jgi:hypothetical protein